jgi:hypothetical protein
MADSAWERELSKQKRRVLWTAAAIAGAIIIAALFIRNNSDLFSKSAAPASGAPGNSENPEKAGKSDERPAQTSGALPASGKQEDSGKRENTVKPEERPMPAASENPEDAGKAAEHPAPAAVAAPASGKQENAGKPETGFRRRIELSGIACSPADRPDVRVTLCVRLSCKAGRAEREILFKREDLKVMAHSVVSKLLMADITAEKLRPALITAMNRILSDGAIDTIEVARFEIDTKR